MLNGTYGHRLWRSASADPDEIRWSLTWHEGAKESKNADLVILLFVFLLVALLVLRGRSRCCQRQGNDDTVVDWLLANEVLKNMSPDLTLRNANVTVDDK